MNLIEIIKAYTEGKTIEYRSTDPKVKDNEWIPKNPFRGDISFYPSDFEYRIQPNHEVKYVLAAHFEDALKTNGFCSSRPYMHVSMCENTKRIKLTFEDNKLTKAEVI
jgi:hypothetical protein